VFLKLSDGFNGADLRNVVTEAGMFAIRDDRYQSLSSDERNPLLTFLSPLQGIYPAGGPYKGSEEGRRSEEARK
jgi:hypothetical protein